MNHGDVIGTYRIERLPFLRRMMMDSLDVVPQGHYMQALLEVDVTAAQAAIRRLQAGGARVSLFAFVVRAIATALSEHPDLNVIRGRRHRVARFEDVDVNIPIELETSEGAFPFMLVLRRASTKSAVDLYREIEAARSRHATAGATGAEDRSARRIMRVIVRLPKLVRRWFLRWSSSNPLNVKRWFGTTFVTSVGKFAQVPGYVIPWTGGPRATAFALGSVIDKPAARDGEVVIRSFLSLSFIVDHDLVDGAPAARFVRRLLELIEAADDSLLLPAGGDGMTGSDPRVALSEPTDHAPHPP